MQCCNNKQERKYYKKQLKKIEFKLFYTPIKWLFSTRNHSSLDQKIITICGLQIKLKSKKLKNKKDIKNLQLKLDNISEKLSQEILKNNEIKNTQKNIEAFERENFYANVLRDSTYNSNWLVDKAFTLTGGAANYSFIFSLFKILEDIEPINILEFGLGQTSKVTTQYVINREPNANLIIIEHDDNWISTFSKKLTLNEKIQICQKNIINSEINNIAIDKYDNLDDIISNKKFDLIVIDGPLGYDRTYPRTNVLDIIPKNLAQEFVILLDDAERLGEQNTAKLIFNKLEEHNIEYLKSYKNGLKKQLIITSPNYKFIHWI